MAKAEVTKALEQRQFVWSTRRAALLKRLIANLHAYSPPQAQALQDLGKRRKWIAHAPFSLSSVEMAQLSRPSSDKDCRRLLDLALLLRCSDQITEENALQLWHLGDNCDNWTPKMRIRWLSCQAQIALQLNSSTFNTVVNNKWNKVLSHQYINNN
jgi:hypothetical protein